MSEVQILLSRNTFRNFLNEKPDLGGLVISLPPKSQNTSMNIHHCVFENQFNWNPVAGMLNLMQSALFIRLGSVPTYPITENNMHIHIHNTTFHNNERALTLSGNLKSYDYMRVV